MASPFPGMDPYLEAPDEWPGVHNSLIYVLAEELNRNLPEGYFARLDARLYVEEPDRGLIPDVALLHRRETPATRAGGAATLEREDIWEIESMPEKLTVFPPEINESFIEIRTLTRPRRIVTVIEILSPANKTFGAGRNAYLRKQRDILSSDANLMEIDLLRRGAHTVAVPEEGVLRRGAWDYLVSLNRAASHDSYEFWRIGLRQRLPQLRVPLAEGESDIPLHLQAAFDRVYVAGRFRVETDYNAPPAVPLEGEDVDWADALLREKGARTPKNSERSANTENSEGSA